MPVCYYVLAEPYWDSSDFYWYHPWYRYLMIIIGIATIIIYICMLVVLNDLKDYLPRFRIVFVSILLSLGFSIAGYFVKNVLVSMTITLLEFGAILCYLYNLYGTMEDITRKLFGKLVGRWVEPGELSEEWRRLKTLYVIAFLVQTFAELISSIILLENNTISLWSLPFILLMIGTMTMLVVYIVEVKLFKKTWNSLERLEYGKGNRKL